MAPPPSANKAAGKAATTAPTTPLMSSDEVNLLVYSYLAESALEHSAFTLYNESRLGEFINEDGTNPAAPPTGHLIKILQKGLLYLQAESKYRGEDLGPGNMPRLIGYDIPDSLPLPPIPRSLPPPPTASSTASTSNNLSSSTQPVSPALLPNEQAGAASQKQPNGSDKVKNKRTNNGSAVAGPSGTSGNTGTKRKETGKEAAEDGQSVNKKLKTAKSPTTVNNDQDSGINSNNNNNDNEEMGPPSLSSSTKSNNKKGKGKAVNTDQQGDSEMADASNVNSTSAPAQASQKEKGPLARAVAAAANATSRALPSAFSGTPSSSQPNGASSSSNPNNLSKSQSRPSSPNLPPGNSTSAAATRRSSSPHVNRSSAGASAAAAAANKNRPRSTSPNTSLRTSQSNPLSISTNNNTSTTSLSSTRKTGSSDTGSTTHNGPMQTPTLDASGIPATTQSKDSKDGAGMKVEDLPKMIPKNVVKDEKVLKLKGHTMPVQPCHWNPKVEALLATGAGDSTMRIWDVPIDQTDKAVEPITCKHASGQRRSDVTTVEWNSDGTLLATGSDDGIARIWTPSGDLHLVLSMHQRTIFTIKWNSKGTMLLTGSLDHSICLWESQYGKMKSQWSSHSDSVLDLDWMTDEIFASCSMDKNIHVHHVNKSSPVYRFKGHSDEVNCLRFDPTKRLLATGSDDCSVRIWSLKPVKNVLGIKSVEADSNTTGDEMSPKKEDSGDDEKPSEPMCLVLKGHKKEVHAVAWSPRVDQAPGEPKIIASASFDCTARIWDVSTGACLHIINRHTDMVYSLSFSPILGEYLATGGNDSRMCITKVKNKELIHEYTAKAAVYEVLWHPSRNQVAVCGKNEVVNVVNFELEEP